MTVVQSRMLGLGLAMSYSVERDLGCRYSSLQRPWYRECLIETDPSKKRCFSLVSCSGAFRVRAGVHADDDDARVACCTAAPIPLQRRYTPRC